MSLVTYFSFVRLKWVMQKKKKKKKKKKKLYAYLFD